MTVADPTAAVETVFRLEFSRVVATLARMTGDLDLAEELAQEALVDALRQWPEGCPPANPGAWLTAVGKRKAIDRFRRDRTLAGKYALIASTERRETGPADVLVTDSNEIDDDRLRLIFVACHPILPVPSRVALTLRLVGGLTTAEIARAFVTAEPTIAQRIVRAKRAIAQADVPFEVPDGDDREGRLSSVLEVVYLIYNEGYSATSGQDWIRPELCTEALRLGRVLAGLAPDEPEVHGLVALMEFQSYRLQARVGTTGAIRLLAEQDRRRWDRLHITRGEAALRRADERAPTRERYALQAAIAACHARSFRLEETDWEEIVALYTTLAQVMPSPIVELNRAVAFAMAHGAEAALPLVEQLVAMGVLDRYHLLHSVHGDMLTKVGRHEEAAAAFDLAAALAQNEPERELSRRRASQSRSLAGGGQRTE